MILFFQRTPVQPPPVMADDLGASEGAGIKPNVAFNQLFCTLPQSNTLQEMGTNSAFKAAALSQCGLHGLAGAFNNQRGFRSLNIS